METSSLVLNDGKMVIEITTFNMDQKSSISNVRKGQCAVVVNIHGLMKYVFWSYQMGINIT